MRSVNKRTLENLALSGAFDSFENEHRAMYFHELKEGYTFLNKTIRYGNAYQESLDAPPDLFGSTEGVELPEPPLPVCDEWERLDLLAREKEVVGIYISGHPLDDYAFEIKHNCNHTIEKFKDLESIKVNKSLQNIRGLLYVRMTCFIKPKAEQNDLTLRKFKNVAVMEIVLNLLHFLINLLVLLIFGGGLLRFGAFTTKA